MSNQLTLQQKHFDRYSVWGLALIACFLTFLVCPFSPIYRYNFETDEICYQTISLGWFKGKIPYRDLFDHKGPLTYVIYLLGFLLSGQNSIGVLFLFMAVNACIFILIYKTMRLYFDCNRSLGGIILLLAMFFIKKYSLYASGTKPDHFILLMLLISEYLYIRGIKRYQGLKQTDEHTDSAQSCEDNIPDKNKSCTPVFKPLEMLIIGLCCGAVFMIKLNACIYYFLFIGFYLLWLLLRKHWKSFFTSCGLFLLGILTVSAPFFIYFKLNHALSDFLYAYFQFNAEYAKKGGIHILFSRPFVDSENELVILILFALLLIAACIFMHVNLHRGTRIILVLCSFLTYIFLTFPEVFAYSFVSLIPLYLWGCAIFTDLLFSFFSKKKLSVALCVLAIVITINFTLYQLLIHPSIPHEKADFEQAMNQYFDANPDSSVIYFMNLCTEYTYTVSSITPDYQYFYAPRESSEEVYKEQIEYIRHGIPSIIVFLRATDMSNNDMENLELFFLENGYSLYFNDNEESRCYVYVRASTLQ